MRIFVDVYNGYTLLGTQVLAMNRDGNGLYAGARLARYCSESCEGIACRPSGLLLWKARVPRRRRLRIFGAIIWADDNEVERYENCAATD